MKKIIALSLLSLVIIVLGGCSYGGSSTNTPAATPTAPTQETPTASGAINIQGFAFSPAAITVKKGATVTWTNNDSAPHQIKSTTFNSSQLGKSQTFSFTFNDAGTFDYSCSIHPSMTGKIIVE
jgi:plastocyanin